MNVQVAYLKALNNVMRELKLEKERIAAGGDSPWTIDMLKTIVQPEMRELLFHASKMEAYYKYGDTYRELESTTLISNRLDLMQTALGQCILSLQDIYGSL